MVVQAECMFQAWMFRRSSTDCNTVLATVQVTHCKHVPCCETAFCLVLLMIDKACLATSSVSSVADIAMM